MEPDGRDVEDAGEFKASLEMEEEQQRAADRRRRQGLERLLVQNEELAWEMERRLQRVERNKAVGRSSKSHEMPHFQEAAARAAVYRRLKEELELNMDLAEEQKGNLEKPAGEQQIRQDEELARLILHDLKIEEGRNEQDDKDIKSPDTPDLQAAAADRRGKQKLRLPMDSEEQKHNLEKPTQEQQIRLDGQLALTLIQQDLQGEEWNEPDDRNIKSQGTPVLQAAAADRRDNQELQLQNGLSEEQMQHLEETVREQQISSSEDQVYDLFFAVSTDDRGFVGVGCMIKDTVDGQVVNENRKCIGVDISDHLAEYSALIIGLKIAQSLGLRRINAHGNPGFIYSEVQRQVAAPWTVEQLDALQKQIKELDSFSLNCVSRAENAEATKLANYVAEHAQPVFKRKSSLEEDTRQQCLICLERIFPPDMVSPNDCGHQFCFNCLSQHVENEVLASMVPVRCPLFTDCAVNLDDNGCKRLVSPKVFDTYLTRLTDAAIPDSEKVYCPFPGCSAMMRRTDENETNRYAASSSTAIAGRTNISRTECMECHRLFCVECHVPWHEDLTCRQYQNLPPDERDAEDRKLFELAKDQKWRRCEKCRRLIVLDGGCFHITCRCGNEFCYTCGTNYRGRQKMCDCPPSPVYINAEFWQQIRVNQLIHGQAPIPDELIPVRQRVFPSLYRARIPEERIPEDRHPEARIPHEMNDELVHDAIQRSMILQEWLLVEEQRILQVVHREGIPEGGHPEERIPEERNQEAKIPHEMNDELVDEAMHRPMILQEQLLVQQQILQARHRAGIPEGRNPEDRIPEETNPAARIRPSPQELQERLLVQQQILQARHRAGIPEGRNPEERIPEERNPAARIRPIPQGSLYQARSMQERTLQALRARIRLEERNPEARIPLITQEMIDQTRIRRRNFGELL